MSAVLVTGASGRLGTLLVPELRSRGHTVRPARRSAGEGWFAVDQGTGEGLAAAVDGVDVVVHAASSCQAAVDAQASGARDAPRR